MGGCRARIFHVNDVYVLDNLPALKTAVAVESGDLPRSNVITTLAGDFLGPSLLSSLDHGVSMVDMMNRVPVDAVCFGNHESDVPYLSLKRRIEEFNGVWLNSNMPGWGKDPDANEPECPHHHVFNLEGGRSLVMLGLNVEAARTRASTATERWGDTPQGSYRSSTPSTTRLPSPKQNAQTPTQSSRSRIRTCPTTWRWPGKATSR